MALSRKPAPYSRAAHHVADAKLQHRLLVALLRDDHLTRHALPVPAAEAMQRRCHHPGQLHRHLRRRMAHADCACRPHTASRLQQRHADAAGVVPLPSRRDNRPLRRPDRCTLAQPRPLAMVCTCSFPLLLSGHAADPLRPRRPGRLEALRSHRSHRNPAIVPPPSAHGTSARTRSPRVPRPRLLQRLPHARHRSLRCPRLALRNLLYSNHADETTSPPSQAAADTPRTAPCDP
jgi:hypothetical protein